MLRKFVLILSLTVLGLSCSSVRAQVLRSSILSPEELLDKYLLFADELSQCFCVKIDGQRSIDGKEFDLYIISAKCASQRASYTAFGLEELGSDRQVFFDERMYLGDRKFYKVSQGFNRDNRPADATVKDKDGNLVARKVSFVDRFDPLALVLTTSSSIAANKVELETVRDRLLKSKLIASSVEKDGKVVGEFLVSNKYSVVQIEFDPKVDYFPITTKVYLYDSKAEKRASVPFASTNTEWTRKAGKVLLPSKILLTYRDAGSKQNDELKLAWADCDVLRANINFEHLAVIGQKVDWQSAFLRLIPEQ